MKNRKPRWFVCDWQSPWDIKGLYLRIGFVERDDLMDHKDAGRYRLIAWEWRLAVGRTWESIEDNLPWPRGFIFRSWCRSDAGEIIKRLAGFPDTGALDNARAIPVVE